MKQVSVEIIHKCPNRCVHCSSFSGMECSLSIPKEKVYEIIDGMEKIGTKLLSISGGEPFLHEHLIEIVQYAKKKQLIVYIYTSGIVLGKNNEAKEIDLSMIRQLKDIGLDRLIFDLPAIDENVYDIFMGTTGYLRFVKKSIENSKLEKVFTEIHFVPTKINLLQIDKVLSYAKESEIDQVSFLGLVPHGRAKDASKDLFLDEKQNNELKHKLNNLKNGFIRIGIPLQIENNEYQCYAGREKLCVRYDGKVFGCEAFKYINLKDASGNDIAPDTIYERTLEDIFYNSLYLKEERKFVLNQMKNCNCEEKCPIQRMLRRAI